MYEAGFTAGYSQDVCASADTDYMRGYVDGTSAYAIDAR